MSGDEATPGVGPTKAGGCSDADAVTLLRELYAMLAEHSLKGQPLTSDEEV